MIIKGIIIRKIKKTLQVELYKDLNLIYIKVPNRL